MKIQIPLTDEQTKLLQPLIDAAHAHPRGRHNSSILVAAISQNWRQPAGWELEVHLLPGERRDAIRAACNGTLKAKRLPKNQS